MPARYAVRLGGSGTLTAVADDSTGLFVGRHRYDDYGAIDETPLPVTTFRLTGVERLVGLDGYEHVGGAYGLGDMDLVILDRRSAVMGRYGYWGTRVVIDEPARVWTLTAYTQVLPHVGAGPVWDRWRDSPPTTRNEWVAIPVGLREGWVEVAALRDAEAQASGLHGPAAHTVRLDGGQVIDLASFLCAVGEAFRGPGGYAGHNFTSLSEFLEKYAGAGVRLSWQDSSVARRSLDAVVDTIDGPMSQFDKVVRTLARGNVDVHLL